MEMVSAAKMRKATQTVLNSRTYALLAWSLVRQLAGKTDSSLHPLLTKRDRVKKIGLVLITSNKGLCGGFNSHIIAKALSYIKKQSAEEVAVEVITMGKKGADHLVKRDYSISANFDKADATVDLSEIRPLSKLLIDDYLSGKFDKVALAYTDFVSTLVQKPRVIEILPLDSDQLDQDLGTVGQEGPEENKIDNDFEYIFEPTPSEVLADLLPRVLETQIYQAILESNASEHSARMVAMKNASEAASEMIEDLTLIFNKARQSAITSELADIVGGRAAAE